MVPAHSARFKELDTILVTGNNLSLLELGLFIVGTSRARWGQCLVTSVGVSLVLKSFSFREPEFTAISGTSSWMFLCFFVGQPPSIPLFCFGDVANGSGMGRSQVECDLHGEPVQLLQSWVCVWRGV